MIHPPILALLAWPARRSSLASRRFPFGDRLLSDRFADCPLGCFSNRLFHRWTGLPEPCPPELQSMDSRFKYNVRSRLGSRTERISRNRLDASRTPLSGVGNRVFRLRCYSSDHRCVAPCHVDNANRPAEFQNCLNEGPARRLKACNHVATRDSHSADAAGDCLCGKRSHSTRVARADRVILCGCRYWFITARQAELSLLLLLSRQRNTSLRFGMAAQHTLNASPMQACRSSVVSATAAGDKRTIAKTIVAGTSAFTETPDCLDCAWNPSV